MQRKNHIDAMGAGLLVFCSALMGLNQVIIKLTNAGLHPVFQAGLRSACGFVPVLLFAIVMKKRLTIRDGSFWPGMLAGLYFGVEFLLLFQALDYTSVSRASVFFYTMPFWVALAAHFAIPGEKLTLVKVAGLVLAMIGVILALSNNPAPASDRALIGDLFCLLGSMLWASIIIVARTTDLAKSSPEMQLLYQLAVSGVLLLLISLTVGELVREVTPTIVALFASQIFIIIFFGFLLWFWLLSIYPASTMASYSFLSPVFGVILGWLILDETIDSTIIIALVLVSVGVFLVSRKPAQGSAT